MTGQSPKYLVQRFLDAFNAADFDRVFGLLAEGAEWKVWVGEQEPVVATPAAMRPQLEHMAKVMPQPVRWEPLSLTAEGEHVFAELRGSGRAASGFEYNNNYAVLFRAVREQIVAIEELFESAPAESLMAELQRA